MYKGRCWTEIFYTHVWMFLFDEGEISATNVPRVRSRRVCESGKTDRYKRLKISSLYRHKGFTPLVL